VLTGGDTGQSLSATAGLLSTDRSSVVMEKVGPVRLAEDDEHPVGS
jgi:hypothetical protein